jgi:hypothetical protein
VFNRTNCFLGLLKPCCCHLKAGFFYFYTSHFALCNSRCVAPFSSIAAFSHPFLLFFGNNTRPIYICNPFGELAQLARALAWHARGQGFDSPVLHNRKRSVTAAFFYYLIASNPFATYLQLYQSLAIKKIKCGVSRAIVSRMGKYLKECVSRNGAY